jgi:hypothetical protein
MSRETQDTVASTERRNLLERGLALLAAAAATL